MPSPQWSSPGKTVDEAAAAPVPWSELAPSDYAVLAPYHPTWGGLENSADDGGNLTSAALLAAVLALVETHVARLTIEEEYHFFGLFVSRTAWVSKGGSQESWPEGSIESSLQESLTKTPVKVRVLVARWIGPERPDPRRDMRDRIVNRLVRQGTVEWQQKKQSFLFFSWEIPVLGPTERTKDALADYASAARRTGLGLSRLEFSFLGRAPCDVIFRDIDKAFTDRTERVDYE